jgi:hypothetical protein
MERLNRYEIESEDTGSRIARLILSCRASTAPQTFRSALSRARFLTKRCRSLAEAAAKFKSQGDEFLRACAASLPEVIDADQLGEPTETTRLSDGPIGIVPPGEDVRKIAAL